MDTGLDCADAPSPAEAGRMLREVKGAFWCVYIGGPTSAATGWTPALVRAYATAGIQQFLPIYCGRQSRGPLTADQGFKDGQEAVRLLQRFGWAPGAPCALDIEQPTGASDPDGATAYADGYSVALRQAGYVPGVYAVPSFLNRLSTETNRPQFVFVASWVRTALDPSRDPAHIAGLSDTAWAGERVWQYAGGPDVMVGDLNVDIDVANCPLAAPPAAAAGTEPGADYIVHTGDTLGAIAAAHGLTLTEVLAINPQVTNPNLIFPGEVIHLSDTSGAGVVTASALRERILAWARDQIGRPYAGPLAGLGEDTRFGNPGFDCSSFVSMAYGQVNLSLTPFTDTMAGETQPIPEGDALPADLVLYRYDDPDQPNVTFPHVGIYLGSEDDGMIDCELDGGVETRKLLSRPREFHRHASLA